MIDINLYEKDLAYQNAYKQSLKDRGEDLSSLEPLVGLNQKRKKSLFKKEELIVERKKIEKQMLSCKSSEEKKKCVEQAQLKGQQVDEIKKEINAIENEISNILLYLPNKCHEKVPVGTQSEDNLVVHTEGKPPRFSFPVKSHVEIGNQHLDLAKATQVSGARFSFLRGELAQLERALSAYMLDVHREKHGYEEIHTPFIVNESSLVGNGQFPKFKEDVFRISNTNFYLIPTGEIPLTQLFSNEILVEEQLPIRVMGYTPCFRSEAGAYGKDTKGLIRQHQFTKVELVILSHPSQSYEELEKLSLQAQQILKDLELHYRVMNLCTGDLGFAAAQCYDIEVWLPSEGIFREISSCSNFEDYQARRSQIRFRSGKQKAFVHTLNGSGLAVGRTLLALLENYQNEDGSVRIPDRLWSYMQGKKVILKK